MAQITAVFFLGGEGNTIDSNSSHSDIGGGLSNTVQSPKSGIFGGESNLIVKNGAHHSFLGGGQSNLIDTNDNHSTISGGDQNHIFPQSDHSTVGGGWFNQIGDGINDQSRTTISGGSYNTAKSWGSVIAGGWNNLCASGTADASMMVIGGGSNNVALAHTSTIPGGDSLIANLYSQCVVGYYNRDTNTFQNHYPHTFSESFIAQTNRYNDPLFQVGNGSNYAGRSNAFEVSYNGHSTVFDNNNSGALPSGRAAIYGSNYVDNIIYAWGDVSFVTVPPIPPFPKPAVVNSNFGVAKVIQTGVGVYDVYLNIANPQGNQIQLGNGAVMVTMINAPCNRFVTYSRFVTSGAFTRFTVTITKMVPVNNPPPGTDPFVCDPVDNDFAFRVTGRK